MSFSHYKMCVEIGRKKEGIIDINNNVKYWREISN